MIRKPLSLLSKHYLSKSSAPILTPSRPSSHFQSSQHRSTLNSTSTFRLAPHSHSPPLLQKRSLFGKAKFNSPNSNKAKLEKEKSHEGESASEAVEGEEINKPEAEAGGESASDESQAEGAPPTAAFKSSEETIAKLKNKISELENSAKEDAVKIDKYIRAIAEERNIYKRFKKKSEEDLKHSAQPFSKDMISVHDDLTRALKFINPELIEEHEEVKKMVTGIEMTAGNLERTFAKHKITKIPALPGTKFDEKIGHEAISLQPLGTIPGVEAGCVAVEIESGWKLHERILRSSRVVVVQE